MEAKQYTRVLVCDRNKCPEYRSLEVSLLWRPNNTLEYQYVTEISVLNIEVWRFPYYGGQTIH